jgi:hypothetical protein
MELLSHLKLVRWQQFELSDLAPFLQQGMEALLVLHNKMLVHGAPNLGRFMFAGDRLLRLPQVVLPGLIRRFAVGSD